MKPSFFTYDVERAVEKETFVFEEKKTSCNEPAPLTFESSWSDCTDTVKTINTGEWRFKRPVLNRDACKQCGISRHVLRHRVHFRAA